jgi:hypothetical protein
MELKDGGPGVSVPHALPGRRTPQAVSGAISVTQLADISALSTAALFTRAHHAVPYGHRDDVGTGPTVKFYGQLHGAL